MIDRNTTKKPLPDGSGYLFDFDVFDTSLVARNKIGIIAIAVRTLLTGFCCRIGLFASVAVADCLDDFKVELTAFPMLGSVLNRPVPAVLPVGGDNAGDLSDFESDFRHFIHVVVFGNLINFLDDVEDNA